MQPHVVHFEIPADVPDRARYFYLRVFGWKSERVEGVDYFELKSKDGKEGIDGGILKRRFKEQIIVNYVNVPNLDDALRKVEQFGGTIIHHKQSVPKTGWMALIKDSEGNALGLWQDDKEAPDNPLVKD